MAFEDSLLERIKRHSAELAAIKKKESRKRKNEKYWEKNKSSIAEYKRSKKDSIAAVNREYYEKNKDSIAAYKHMHWKQNYQSNKESILHYRQEYYRKNKESISQHQQDYNRNNKESISHYKQEYNQNNKESISHYKQEYYRKNKESISQRKQEYCQNNKESISHYKQEYYQNNKESILLKYNENKKKPFTSDDRYSDFGKKVYPKLSYHRNLPQEDSSTPRGFYCLNSNSTPEEIQNSLMQHCNTPEGRRAVANRIERVTERFSRINIVEEEGPDFQRAHVCVICDEFIIGMEEIKWLSKEDILDNKHRLSVESYEMHYRIRLKDDLKIQYSVVDCDLEDILLSPRAWVKDNCYCCCSTCHGSLICGSAEEKDNPPKLAIANGFVIGHIPKLLKYWKGDNVVEDYCEFEIDPEKHLDDTICTAISPVRPFGALQAWTGGAKKSITGHFSFFAVDQSHVGGVLNKYRNIEDVRMRTSKNIFVVLCGRMTPDQKKIVRKQKELDTEVFLHLLNWFARESGHSGYSDVVPPDECPDLIVYLEEEEKENNTDNPVDPDIECRIEGKKYYFSNSDHNPSETTSCYDASDEFVKAMLEGINPTMVLYGGSYLKSHEVKLEDIFPIQFPFGLGGPKPDVQRKVPVSEEVCLRHYMRLSLNQFMRPDFILVCYHIMCRTSSFTTGLIKCRSDYKGTSLAERVSNLTVSEVEKAATDLMEKQANNEPATGNTSAAAFLKSISTSCRVLGHTTEAAKDARRKMYSITDRKGCHSLMFTVTPCDLCTFRVRMFANNGMKIKIPTVDCTDHECFLDFELRVKKRIRYPGASSLYFQSALQAVYELLGWDPIHNRSKGVGIFGLVDALGKAAEEQDRGTLHAHILVWLKNFAEIMKLVFHPDPDKRESAREELRRFVDHHFHSDYNYSTSLEVIHERCEQCGTIEEMFSQSELQDLRDSRNKNLLHKFQGKILLCRHCEATDENPLADRISTPELSDIVINSHKMNSTTQPNRDESEITFPPDKYRVDIMTYRYPIDEMSPDSDDFYFNKTLRGYVAIRKMNEHDLNHRRQCFKKGCECRAKFPRPLVPGTYFYYDDNDESKCVKWRFLEESTQDSYPFYVESKRSNGSQYLNTHNRTVSELLACNNNLQMGSARCIFYVVHYATKSTQKEDRGVDYDRIGYHVINRINKEKERLEAEERERLEHEQHQVQGENSVTSNENNEPSNENYAFREGLIRFLIGITIHLAQVVVSAAMAHYIICQRGSRFKFSHDFKDLLVTQMLNFLEGDDPGEFVLKRRNRGEGEEPIMWPDYSCNDYIYRPRCLDEICYYESVTKYEKKYFTFSEMANRDEDGLPILDEAKGMHFEPGHPGRRFCYLTTAPKEYIPKVSSPRNMICDLEHLELDTNEPPSEAALRLREDYAKCAMVMFYPFRDAALFLLDDNDTCLWDKFMRVKNNNDNHQIIRFWAEGKVILQNMQDRIQSAKSKLAADLLESHTEDATPIDLTQNPRYYQDSDSEYEDAESIGFCEREDDDFIDEESTNVYTRVDLDDLKRGKKMRKEDLINPRIMSGASLFSTTNDSGAILPSPNVLQSRDFECTRQGFSHLLAFVSGATVGTRKDITSDDETMEDVHSTPDANDRIISSQEWGMLGISPDFDTHHSIPTINDVARRISNEKNIYLDRIQYIAYKIICSSFMLGVLNEGWDIRQSAPYDMTDSGDTDVSSTERNIKEKLTSNLKELGGKDQLLMFITGPAGAGKSTSLEVAQHFCFEFCRCIGYRWDDSTFLFTAMTGCAASLFGGVTLHSAAFLNCSLGKIKDTMLSSLDNVKFLVVDEVSMGTEANMKKLSDVLNMAKKRRCRHSGHIPPNMVFGGYHVVFCGDFHQIPPVKAKDSDLLYSGGGMWENAINVAIVLRNSHRFNDDPEYGEILLRIWKGELSDEDRIKINTRLVGLNGVNTPEVGSDSDIAYACPTNSMRNMIQAELFEKHIENFPLVTSNDLPPETTVVLEADINRAPDLKPKKGINQQEDTRPESIRVSRERKQLIYSRCGDADLKAGNKCIDPALKLYIGAHCMINDNDNIKEGRANGTLCRLVSIKRKTDNPLTWKNYNGRKVYTVNAKDVEYAEFEHFPPNFTQKKLLSEISRLEELISSDSPTTVDLNAELEKAQQEYNDVCAKRRFKLYPKTYYCIFNRNLIDLPDDVYRSTNLAKQMKRRNCKVKMLQLPVNLNDATTGHKLQGMTKQNLIVRSWSYTSGWIYTILSRVRTLDGLYLNEELRPSKKNSDTAFGLSQALKSFEYRMQAKIPTDAI